MANIFTRFIDSFNRGDKNKFNQAFLSWTGVENTSYDPNGEAYIKDGYNINSVVFSVINQQSVKTSSIPYTIRKIEDKKAKAKLDRYYKRNHNLTVQQQVKKMVLESKAYEDNDLEMPLERPNVNQNWAEFHALYKTFLATNGNVYIYMLSPEDGMNKGEPQAIYLLPSQDIKIVIKDDVDMLGVEDPIKGYMLIQGEQCVTFDSEKVIHIKTANPNYDESGEHLYGMSRLKAAGRNILNSNKALKQNTKTLANGGAFGLIHGKNIALTETQAAELKERLVEMNSSEADLAKIAGMSGEVGFTRISLTTAELQPFEYLKYDQKQICNVLGWSDKLLNNDDASTMNNIDNERKRVITDNIQPDLLLLQEAINNYLLPKFKGYENTEIVYDISELPEMQQDTKAMVEWAVMLVDRGVLNRNEVREITTFISSEDPNMDIYTVNNDLLTLDEAINSDFNIEPPM